MAVALWSAARFRDRPGWGPALWFTFAVSYAALLRPDGALAAVALAPALLIGLKRGDGAGAISTRKLARMAVVLPAAGFGAVCGLDMAQRAGLSRL